MALSSKVAWQWRRQKRWRKRERAGIKSPITSAKICEGMARTVIKGWRGALIKGGVTVAPAKKVAETRESRNPETDHVGENLRGKEQARQREAWRWRRAIKSDGSAFLVSVRRVM